MAENVYNAIGSLMAQELNNGKLKEDIKIQLQEFFKNEQDQSIEVQELKRYLKQLKDLVRTNPFDDHLSLKAQEYYRELDNKELFVFKNNKKTLNEAHDIILKIRDLFGRILNISNDVVIYKMVDGKIRRLTKDFFKDSFLNNSRSRYSARIGITQQQIESLQKLNSLEELFSKHYFDFKKVIDNSNKKQQWPSYNQGHIAEAFEGHFQHDEGGQFKDKYHNFLSKKDKQDAYIHFYYAIRNKDIWYKGGDIGDVQVKYMDSKKLSISAGSKLSLREIITFLINTFDDLLFNQKEYESIDFDKKAEKIMKVFFTAEELSQDLSTTASGNTLHNLLGLNSNGIIDLQKFLKS